MLRSLVGSEMCIRDRYIRDIQSKMFMEMQAQKQQDKRPYSAHVKRVNKFKNDVKKEVAMILIFLYLMVELFLQRK